MSKLVVYFGTLEVGLRTSIPLLVWMNVVNFLLRSAWLIVMVAIEVLPFVSTAVVNSLLLLPLLSLVSSITPDLLNVMFLLLSTLVMIRVAVVEVTSTRGILPLSSGCLTLCMLCVAKVVR